MYKYKLNFNMDKEEYVDYINVKGFDLTDNVVYDNKHSISGVFLDENVITCEYSDKYFFYIDDNIYCDNYYNISVFINTNQLGENDYSYSSDKKMITISYKINLIPGDVVVIRYYKKKCFIDIECEPLISKVDIRTVYKKTHKLGAHTELI